MRAELPAVVQATGGAGVPSTAGRTQGGWVAVLTDGQLVHLVHMVVREMGRLAVRIGEGGSPGITCGTCWSFPTRVFTSIVENVFHVDGLLSSSAAGGGGVAQGFEVFYVQTVVKSGLITERTVR